MAIANAVTLLFIRIAMQTYNMIVGLTMFSLENRLVKHQSTRVNRANRSKACLRILARPCVSTSERLISGNFWSGVRGRETTGVGWQAIHGIFCSIAVPSGLRFERQ